MSDTDRTQTTLRVEPLESRLALSTAGTTGTQLPPPDVIVFGGDAATTSTAQPTADSGGSQLAFGGDPVTPGPTHGGDTLIGGAGNDTLRGGAGNDII